jgi:hypothetical protein
MKKLVTFGYVVVVFLHGNLNLFPRTKMLNFHWLTSHDSEGCWRCRLEELWDISEEWTILRVCVWCLADIDVRSDETEVMLDKKMLSNQL